MGGDGLDSAVALASGDEASFDGDCDGGCGGFTWWQAEEDSLGSAASASTRRSEGKQDFLATSDRG